jgi:nitrate reductase gamma subunit
VPVVIYIFIHLDLHMSVSRKESLGLEDWYVGNTVVMQVFFSFSPDTLPVPSFVLPVHYTFLPSRGIEFHYGVHVISLLHSVSIFKRNPWISDFMKVHSVLNMTPGITAIFVCLFSLHGLGGV